MPESDGKPPRKRRPPPPSGRPGKADRPAKRGNGGRPKPAPEAAKGARQLREMRTFKLSEPQAAHQVSDDLDAATGENLELEDDLQFGEMAAAAREEMPTIAGPSAPGGPSLGASVKTGLVSAFVNEVRIISTPHKIAGSASIVPMLVLFTMNLFDGLDTGAFGLLIPEIRDYFGINLFTVTAMIALAGLFTVIFAVPIGYMADRLNRVRMSALGTGVWGFFSAFTAVAPGVWWLAGARFGSGIGKSLDSSHLSLLSDYYPPAVRPGVLAFHQSANRVAAIVGPLVSGFLASWLFWQAPFFLYAIPAFILVFIMLTKLKHPVRGNQERRLMGASEEVAQEAEKPPSWGESWRITWNVRTLRRIYMAIPILVGAGTVVAPLMATYYFEVWGLTPAQRGVVFAIDEPFSLAGLVVGGVIATRLIRFRPGRIITYVGVLSAILAFQYVAIALAPFLWIAVGFRIIGSFLQAVFQPALLAILTIVIPPRVRSFSISLFSWFAAPGLLVAVFGGAVGDRFGLRAAILMLAPVFLLGAIIIASAGLGVEPDMRQALAASMAAYQARESKQIGKAKMLIVKDLDVHYDQVQILFNVDFEVDEGELVALLGTNGAGKSTLLRAISGLTPPSNGATFFDGEDITYLPANEHAEKGIVFMPGGRSLFPTLTVAENLKLASWMFRKDDQYVEEAVARVLEYFPILRERWNEQAGNLSGGEQQMLGLGQAFLSKPRLLMIDELSLGLAPFIVEQLLKIVRDIHEQGTTIILVEQSVNVALTVANRAVFMEKGEVRFSGPTAELMQRGDILRSVFLKGASAAGGSLGGSASPYAQGRKTTAAGPDQREVVLDVREVRKRFGGVTALNGISFTLEEGKILGVIGPNGAGKTTVFDVISGFITPDEGRVLLMGEDITELTPDQRAKLGLQRSFQDARLFPALTVKENIAVALEQHVEVRSATMAALRLPNVRSSERKIERRAERLIELLNLGDFRDKFVRELSTGSKRIVDLACVMAADPKVVLLDEPSSGVAQAETEELGPLLLRVKYETGCSMLVIEHDMTLIKSVSDELLALDLGTVVTRGLPEEVTEHPRVVEAYLGTDEEAIMRSGQLS